MTLKDESRESIRSFYDHKCVLVTGATGFVGRFLIYRLLATCNLSKIYILIRPKRGNYAQQRLDKYLREQIFSHLRDATALQKVVAVEGDITLPNLGLNAIDEARIKQDVSMIFHAAASIRLNQSLK